MKRTLIEGDIYYGHGEVMCFDCSSQGKILGEVGGGEYNRDAPTQAEVSSLITIANSHERKHISHDVRVYEFKRTPL